MNERAVLQLIDGEREIPREFLYEFQKDVLLALKEEGRLDDMQYRYAEDKLRAQFRR